MAAAQHLQGPRLPRSESLQKMLDLEKQFKLARDQAQTEPSPPIQARRRDSRESLSVQSQQHPHIASRRSGPASPLSISIPTPRTATAMTESSTASIDGNIGAADGNGEDEVSSDDGDDAKSEQSSICQSPSWEGYGRKKRDKKKKQEAGQQMRDKSKADNDTRPPTRRRTTNRLFKTPPAEGSDTISDHARPPSSASTTTDTKAGRTTPSGHRSLLPDVWCVAMGSGLSGQMVRPPYTRSASSLGVSGTQEKTVVEGRESTNFKAKGKGKKTDSNGTHEKNYPPLSSRSHALRHSLLPVHIRQKSVSSITSGGAGLGLMMDDQTRTPKDNYLYATKNLSDQSVDYAADPAVTRGRQSIDPMSSSTSTSASSTTGSYVRQARAQSIERSIKGFMQEAALSDPNLLNAPNRMAFSYIGPKTEKNGIQPGGQNDGNHRPGSSQLNMRSGKDKEASAEKPVKPDHHINTNNNVIDHANSDYFALATNNYSPANMDPGTPSSGILSSIKSRISRRSSISSGSTSNTGRSFRERAMGAIHLQSTSASAVPNGAEAALMPSRKPSQNLTTFTPAAGLNTNAEVMPPAKTEQKPTLAKDRRLLPKAARVLGEINPQTMLQGAPSRSRPSEGSSASSNHEDSSVPPSPVSTPHTSRPQSTKDATIPADSASVDVANRNGTTKSNSTETLSAATENSLTEGLGILDEAWSQSTSTVAPDNDAQSFVTTLTNQKSATSLRSQTGILNLKEAALLSDHDLGTHPALKDIKNLKDLQDEDSSRRRRIVSHPMKAVSEEPVKGHRNSTMYPQPPTRRPVPMMSSPLTKVILSAQAMPTMPLSSSSTAVPDNRTIEKPGEPRSPRRIPAQEPEQQMQMQMEIQTQAPATKQTQIQPQLPAPKQPVAKMLVECCRCKFFHDMPSRVYECMAQPDAVVTDSNLGVSGAITTMVKCPWCAHNMSTACCAGYAAMVYLKERLH